MGTTRHPVDTTSARASGDPTDAAGTPPEHRPPSPQQHALPLSILLHLLPGAALTVFIVLAAPVVRAAGFPSVFALFVGIPLVIVPIELGILLLHARRATGSFSLRATVVYRERMATRRLVPMVLGLFAWFTVLLALATAVLDEWIAARFFTWVPDAILQFSAVQEAGESAPAAATLVMIVVAFVFNGVVGPVTEELYFRGYLLPRIDRYGRWAPVLNTVLFSLYHFWTPWQNLTRIVGFLPLTWVAWRRRSTQVAMAAHVTINLVFLLGLLALVAGGS
ncbi:lysostaphin resistance A-like protein [Egicoccus sp. AB-alg2]|uniref:CPBP family intramembrane glutamic endopeptidase n=1 Tax=Egicoccus sp. AB-alg2 TaxID=3242693 RepID=UPI00359E0670